MSIFAKSIIKMLALTYIVVDAGWRISKVIEAFKEISEINALASGLASAPIALFILTIAVVGAVVYYLFSEAVDLIDNIISRPKKLKPLSDEKFQKMMDLYK